MTPKFRTNWSPLTCNWCGKTIWPFTGLFAAWFDKAGKRHTVAKHKDCG